MRFLTERGQNVNGQPNIIYVSADNGAIWSPLHEFVDVSFFSSGFHLIFSCKQMVLHLFCFWKIARILLFKTPVGHSIEQLLLQLLIVMTGYFMWL